MKTVLDRSSGYHRLVIQDEAHAPLNVADAERLVVAALVNFADSNC